MVAVIALLLGVAIGLPLAAFLIHVHKVDRRRAIELDARYGPQLREIVTGTVVSEQGSVSPDPVETVAAAPDPTASVGA